MNAAPPPAQGARRDCDAILNSALAELEERAARLEPFVAELDEVRRAMKVIEKALDLAQVPAKKNGQPAGAGARLSPRQVFRDRITTLIQATDRPMTTGEIAFALDRKPDSFLDACIRELETAGTIVEKHGGRWTAPD